MAHWPGGDERMEEAVAAERLAVERETATVSRRPEWWAPLTPAVPHPADVVDAEDEADRAADERLRRAVRSYTHALRERSVRPERALLLVKEIVRDSSLQAPPRTARLLLERTVSWCIAAYFEDDASSDRS